MRATLRQVVTRSRWLIAVAVSGLAVGYLSLAAAGTNPAVNETHRADPGQFRAGALNPDAVQQAKTFDAFPILWLGEQFDGYSLTTFLRAKNDGQDAVYLIYGTCSARPGMAEPSCVPPVEVITNAPGAVPDPDNLGDGNPGPKTTIRGVTARVLSGNTFLWTGGVTVAVSANSEHLTAALDRLSTVNHDAMGRAAVTSGESLAVLGR